MVNSSRPKQPPAPRSSMPYRIEEEVLWLEPEESCDVSVRIVPHNAASAERKHASAMVVHASRELLSSIPYFESTLSAPWQACTQKKTRPEICLECASPKMCPTDYGRCLQFLKPEHMMFTWTVGAILNVLRVADYMNYQDCAELCMKYVASVQWSDTDEVAAFDTFSAMGMKPSADFCERIEPMKNALEFVKEVIVWFANNKGMHTDQWKRLTGLMKEAVNVSPKVACTFRIALWEAWKKVNDEISRDRSNMNLWGTLTKVNLLYGDEIAVMNAFVENCESFCHTLGVMGYSQNKAYFFDCLIEMLNRLVPKQGQKRPSVLLSVDKRVSLFVALKAVAIPNVQETVTRIASTLPIQHPLVRSLWGEVYFKDEASWRKKLFLLVDRSVDAKALNDNKDFKHFNSPYSAPTCKKLVGRSQLQG